MRRAVAVALSALLVVLWTVAPATARRRNIPTGLLIVLEGYRGPRRPNDWGTTGLWLYLQGESYQFQLKNLRVINSGILPNQIITALIPSRPSLFLYGDRSTLERFQSAPMEDAIAITGYTQASRQLQVSEVVVSPPNVTPAATTPTVTPP